MIDERDRRTSSINVLTKVFYVYYTQTFFDTQMTRAYQFMYDLYKTLNFFGYRFKNQTIHITIGERNKTDVNNGMKKHGL